ncbi:hypothetical protein [Providencia rettgeri]|uniref:hypothetical protein n=1 Tax=Providencia rettgeri TaxID=587 RepID=UPI000D7E1BD0|nr:hypothetical protein [Providencia rettgeri]AWS50754.1 hypothetical protein AM461_07990 [Providencia rettgeri]
MFIEIDSSYTLTPKLIFKGSEGGVIKKSQIRKYSDAKALLLSIENRVEEYQNILENKVNKLIKERQNELNKHVDELNSLAEQQVASSQKEWFSKAEQQLDLLLSNQEDRFNNMISEVKCKVEKAVRNRLIRMNQSDSLIKYVIEVMHNEINDTEKMLQVVHSKSAQGTLLTIENDDCIITINTQELISELKSCIENIPYV